MAETIRIGKGRIIFTDGLEQMREQSYRHYAAIQHQKKAAYHYELAAIFRDKFTNYRKERLKFWALLEYENQMRFAAWHAKEARFYMYWWNDER